MSFLCWNRLRNHLAFHTPAMSRRSAWYAVDLAAVRSTDRSAAAEFVEVAVLEMNERFAGEVTHYEVDVLRHAFGLKQIVGDPSQSVERAVQWICHNFGTPLFHDFLPPVYYMEVDTRLEEYRPPFGLPAPEEGVSYLSRAEVISEFRLLAGCDQEDLQFDEAEYVLAARKQFLEALEKCMEKACDLVVLEG